MWFWALQVKREQQVAGAWAAGCLSREGGEGLRVSNGGAVFRTQVCSWGGAGAEVALWDQMGPWGANSLNWVLWELEWGWGSLKATIVASLSA